jgi:hypothetical protein
LNGFDFLLNFVAIAVATGSGAWSAPAGCLVLSAECTLPTLISDNPMAQYPNSNTGIDGLKFVCGQAGRFDCAFRVEQGATIWTVVNSPSAYKVCLGYVIDPPALP